MKTLIAPLLAAALLFGTVAHAQQVQPLDRIVAVVDEDVILQSELDLALNNVLAQYVGREDQLPPREILQRQVLERLVLVHLQTARAGEMRSEEHTSELQALMRTSYAVFCLKKKRLKRRHLSHHTIQNADTEHTPRKTDKKTYSK